MRFLFPFIIIAMTASGCRRLADCPPNPVCEKVTTENWNSSKWDGRQPSELCEQNMSICCDGFTPCTLGNVPFICKEQGDGSTGVYRLGGDAVTFIHPEDMSRVGEGLKIIQ